MGDAENTEPILGGNRANAAILEVLSLVDIT
jgi:hypothetical protein